LRTDSVNRGFSISLLTLAIVALADCLYLFLFTISKYWHGPLAGICSQQLTANLFI
jgi:hypothetical protein